MARPNLSFEHLAIVLCALGGCAKAAEPASVKSDKATTITAPSAVATATATPTPIPSASAAAPGRGGKGKDGTGQASCGAGSCTADMKKK